MQDVFLSILFDLLQNRRSTAPALASKYGVSPRTIYRWVNRLSAFVPLRIERGRQGGIFLYDDYRLPTNFFTEEEHEGLISALHLAYAKTANPHLLSAKEKLDAVKISAPSCAVCNAGDIWVYPTEEEEALAVKISCTQAALKEKKVLRILLEEQRDRTEKAPARKEYAVEPHLLVLRGGNWYLWAFSYIMRSFYPFPLNEILGVFKTNDRFRPRKFSSEELLSGIPGMR